MASNTEQTPAECIADIRQVQAMAGLSETFDGEISKLQFRGTSEHAELEKQLKALGEQLTPYVETQLGRKVKSFEAITSVALHTGEVKKSAALFFVDTVKGGNFIFVPAAGETVKGYKAASHAAERGRLVVALCPGKYVLAAAEGRARAVLLFN